MLWDLEELDINVTSFHAGASGSAPAAFALPAGLPPAGADAAGAAQDEKSPALIKESLEKYVAELHAKAATLNGWLSNLSPPSNARPSDRCKQFLGSSLIRICHSRFVADLQPQLTMLDECFLALAECQHTLDVSGVSDEFLDRCQIA